MHPTKPIHIRAVDLSGAPVAGVTIGADSVGMKSSWHRIGVGTEIFDQFAAKTDSEGRATLENLPAKSTINFAVKDDGFAVDRDYSVEGCRNPSEQG